MAGEASGQACLGLVQRRRWVGGRFYRWTGTRGAGMPLTFRLIGGPRRARIFSDLVKMQISVYLYSFLRLHKWASEMRSTARKYTKINMRSNDDQRNSINKQKRKNFEEDRLTRSDRRIHFLSSVNCKVKVIASVFSCQMLWILLDNTVSQRRVYYYLPLPFTYLLAAFTHYLHTYVLVCVVRVRVV